MALTKEEKIKKIIYCEDKMYVCPFCGNEVDKDTDIHCKDNMVAVWAGCYCCDDLKCCEDDCTCNYQALTDDDTYGYLS